MEILSLNRVYPAPRPIGENRIEAHYARDARFSYAVRPGAANPVAANPAATPGQDSGRDLEIAGSRPGPVRGPGDSFRRRWHHGAGGEPSRRRHKAANLVWRTDRARGARIVSLHRAREG